MQTSACVCVHVCLCVHFICILFVYLSALVLAGVEKTVSGREFLCEKETYPSPPRLEEDEKRSTTRPALIL